jgi:hypothetical protein
MIRDSAGLLAISVSRVGGFCVFETWRGVEIFELFSILA